VIGNWNGWKRPPVIAGVTLALLLVGGGLAATLTKEPAISMAGKDRAQIEVVVREYILAHPEIIPEAINRMREKQSSDAYAANRAALETPFASAWAGAEKGDVTLVMFSDYACGYCRSSVPDVERLLAEDHGLKVVWREIPILGPGSEVAAKASLAAARQGAFLNFHKQMFAAGRPDGEKVSNVLRSLRIDLRQVQQDVDSPAVAKELRNNLQLVAHLDESVATPTFFVGGQMLKGAVGYAALKQAIAEARAKKAGGAV
jgi:protein-disulfide isomerase